MLLERVPGDTACLPQLAHSPRMSRFGAVSTSHSLIPSGLVIMRTLMPCWLERNSYGSAWDCSDCKCIPIRRTPSHEPRQTRRQRLCSRRFASRHILSILRACNSKPLLESLPTRGVGKRLRPTHPGLRCRRFLRRSHPSHLAAPAVTYTASFARLRAYTYNGGPAPGAPGRPPDHKWGAPGARGPARAPGALQDRPKTGLDRQKWRFETARMTNVGPR